MNEAEQLVDEIKKLRLLNKEYEKFLASYRNNMPLVIEKRLRWTERMWNRKQTVSADVQKVLVEVLRKKIKDNETAIKRIQKRLKVTPDTNKGTSNAKQ